MTQPYITTYDNLLSPEQCSTLIQYIDSHECPNRTVNQRYQEFITETDNEFRHIFEIIRTKINPHITINDITYELVDYSHHVAIHKDYSDTGVPFHYDGSLHNGNLLNLTKALIYLNTFDGGETIFYAEKTPWESTPEQRQSAIIYTSTPKAGAGLVFDLRLPHTANPPGNTKYGLGMRLLYKPFN